MERKSEIKGYIAERAGGKVSSRYVLVRFAGRVAARLDEIRREQGLSQADLAVLVGTSKPQVNRLLSGDYTGMTATSMCKVAAALGYVVDPDIHPAVQGRREGERPRYANERRVVSRARRKERVAVTA